MYNLVVRDLKVRYKHSFLGFFWSLLNPLLLMAVFTFVFTRILSAAYPMFHVFFLSALLPWNWCASSVTGTLGSIVNSGYLIKKVYFPRELLPFALVVSNMVNYVLSLPALIVFMFLFRVPEAGDILSPNCHIACINEHILWLPLLLIIQAMFLIGIGFFLAALNVFFRDTSVLVEVGLQAWFFLTPIIYDPDLIKAKFPQLLYYLNPMASIVTIYRNIFYNNDAASPDPVFIMRTFVECGIILALGYLFFMRLSRTFGEEI